MNLFPYQTVRESQDLLIKDIQTTINNQQILLANAPTGLGKTASALSVTLNHALNSNKTIFFLTNRHTQHQIAIETLKEIKSKHNINIPCIDLIGKKWMCNQEIAGLFGTDFTEYCKHVVEKNECEHYNNVKNKNNLTVEAKLLLKQLQQLGPLHNEELIKLCREKKMCSYEMAFALAKKTKVLIGDYNYLFNPFIQSTIFNKLDLEMENIVAIIDEGHNLPRRVTEMLSNNLSSFMLKNALMECKKFGYKGLILWLQEINTILNNLAQFKQEKEKIVTKDQFLDQIKKITDYDQLIDELEQAADEVRKKQRKSYLGGIATFLQVWKNDSQGFIRYISERKTKYGPLTMLTYACLDPSIVTKEVFSQVDSGIIMSGTLNPTFMYKDILGIKNGIEKDYPSPFPLENKISIIIPETTTKFTARNEQMYEEIADRCSKLAGLIPGNVAFFFPSYYLRDQVCLFIKTEKKLFWEKSEMSKEEKEIFINSFKEENESGGVLLGIAGANFAEGIDLPGDLLKGVVIVGLPLAKPNLITKQIIQYFEDKFQKGWDYGYTFPAMNKCLQSAGRCIRSGEDKGAIIYLDVRFTWPNYYACLPKEGLIVSKNYAELLEEFFN
ncbi:MAG: ATP-dependent DNA helicase [Nanoarchaeota archaeon]|nr:ATP-dependent DNA helicase [Nanoarchaeota archaeon]